MDTRKKGPTPTKAKGFTPRRSIDHPAKETEARVPFKCNVPASLVKDIHLYALQAGRSVPDVVATILRRAIPRLEVVAMPDKMTGTAFDRGVAQLEEPAVRNGDDAGSSPVPANGPNASKKAA